MIRSTVTEAAETLAETPETVELVPVSHLALELPAPTGGWSAWLADKGVPVVADSIGRRAVSAEDARRLLAEHAERVERQRAARQARRGSRPRRRPSGVRVELPDGTLPVSAMLQAAQDAEPRRTSVLEDALAGGQQLRRSLRRRVAS